jgi:hypothetical protein
VGWILQVNFTDKAATTVEELLEHANVCSFLLIFGVYLSYTFPCI